MHRKAFLEVISLVNVVDRIASDRRKTLKNIFIGLIISAPLLVIVIALLAEADTVFQNLIVNVFKPLEFIGSIPFAERVGIIAIITVLLFGYLAVVLKAKVEGISAPTEAKYGGLGRYHRCYGFGDGERCLLSVLCDSVHIPFWW